MKSEYSFPRETCALRSRTKEGESAQSGVGNLWVRTSLTGIEETPISIAMNQHALIRELTTTPYS